MHETDIVFEDDSGIPWTGRRLLREAVSTAGSRHQRVHSQEVGSRRVCGGVQPPAGTDLSIAAAFPRKIQAVRSRCHQSGSVATATAGLQCLSFSIWWTQHRPSPLPTSSGLSLPPPSIRWFHFWFLIARSCSHNLKNPYRFLWLGVFRRLCATQNYLLQFGLYAKFRT